MKLVLQKPGLWRGRPLLPAAAGWRWREQARPQNSAPGTCFSSLSPRWHVHGAYFTPCTKALRGRSGTGRATDYQKRFSRHSRRSPSKVSGRSRTRSLREPRAVLERGLEINPKVKKYFQICKVRNLNIPSRQMYASVCVLLWEPYFLGSSFLSLCIPYVPKRSHVC